jgi:hypothetical protein
MRLLADILRPVRPDSQDSRFPIALPDFDRILESPGLLMTTPDTRSFGVVEDKIRGRIGQLTADAQEAQRSAAKAQAWFQDLQKQWQAAPEDKRDRILAEQHRSAPNLSTGWPCSRKRSPRQILSLSA